MKRDQFTFYRSYYEALKNLPEEERAKVLFAILEYALDEQEQNKLEGICAACFLLIRPTLDSGRIKAANRKNKTKTNEEQNGNKAGTKAEQNRKEREKEGECEKEREVESEVECEREKEVESEYDSITPNPSFDLTDDELRRIRQEQADVEAAAKRVGLPVSALGDFDTMDNLRFEHGVANLLKAISKVQGATEKSRNWKYIGGILKSEKSAGYTWAEKPPAVGAGGTAGDHQQVLTRNPFALQSLKLREGEAT